MADSKLADVVGDALQTAMYFMGPFFGNPVKPFVQTFWCKTDYDLAYKHFKSDHTKPFNLFLHGIALFSQIFSNFAFLHRIEELIGSPAWGVLSAPTAALWAGLLIPQRSAPVKARALVLAAIALGYAIRKKVAEKSEWLMWASGVVEALQFKQYFRLVIPKSIRPSYAPFESAAIRYLATRWTITAALTPLFKKGGALGKNLTACFMLPLLVWASYKPYVVHGYRKTLNAKLLNINNYHFLGWLLYLLTGEKLFFLHSAAFSSNGIQGLGHYYGAEEGTLMQLNDAHNEFAHCSYFPVLVAHRILEHLGNRAKVVAMAAAKAANGGA